jgi:tRNA A37 threonylcarbamoyladenosine modification protein TsaB
MTPANSSLSKAAPTLVLDACGTTIRAGILRDGIWLHKTDSPGEALQHVFDLTLATLNATGLKLQNIRQFIYAGGPGSTLGIRVSCMAIASWATIATEEVSIFRYNSLHLAALSYCQKKPTDPNALFATAIRKGFYLTTRADTPVPEFDLLSTADLEQMPAAKVLIKMGSRFDAAPPQMECTAINYQIDLLPEVISRSPALLEQQTSPQPYTFGNMEYKKWQGERHRQP